MCSNTTTSTIHKPQDQTSSYAQSFFIFDLFEEIKGTITVS